MNETYKHIYIVRDERSTYYPDNALITTDYTLVRKHILDRMRTWLEQENIIIVGLGPCVKFTVDVSCLDEFTQPKRLITLDNIYNFYEYFHETPEKTDFIWEKLETAVNREYQAHHDAMEKRERARKEWSSLTRPEIVAAVRLLTGSFSYSSNYRATPEVNDHATSSELIDKLVEGNSIKTITIFRQRQKEYEEKKRAAIRKDDLRLKRMHKKHRSE